MRGADRPAERGRDLRPHRVVLQAAQCGVVELGIADHQAVRLDESHPPTQRGTRPVRERIREERIAQPEAADEACFAREEAGRVVGEPDRELPVDRHDEED